jgi:glycosyltransferase involved in cell wall biosynthesis
VPVELGIVSNRAIIRIAEWLERAAYSNAELVVGLSPGMVARVLEVSPDSHTIMVPNLPSLPRPSSKDVEIAVKLLADNDIAGPFALYAGDMSLIHDVEYIVNLADQSRKYGNSIKFLLCGGGNRSQGIREYARAKGVLGEFVVVHGKVAKGVISTLTEMSAFTFSTAVSNPVLEQNSANKFFDSLGYGVPVFINYGGWQEDILRRTGAGVRLPRDVVAAAETLAGIVSSPISLNEMRNAAGIYSRTEANLPQIVGDLVDAVEAALLQPTLDAATP